MVNGVMVFVTICLQVGPVTHVILADGDLESKSLWFAAESNTYVAELNGFRVSAPGPRRAIASR